MAEGSGHEVALRIQVPTDAGTLREAIVGSGWLADAPTWTAGLAFDADDHRVEVRERDRDRIRLAWQAPDGTPSRVEVRIEEGPPTAVAVRHAGLPDAETTRAMRTLWKDALRRLVAAL